MKQILWLLSACAFAQSVFPPPVSEGGSQTPWTSNINAAGYSLTGIPAIKPTSDSTTAFQFKDANSNTYINLDSLNRNVGLNTTSPGAKLEIAGTANQLRISDAGAPSANYYDIVRNGSTGFLDFKGSQATFNGFNFKNNSGSTILYLDPAQKVGIGKAPTATLDVNGSAAINGATSLLGNIIGGVSSSLYFDSTNSQLRVGNNPSSGLWFNGAGEFHARRESANATIRIAVAGTSNNPYLAFDRSRGTIASPTAVQAGDVLGSIVGLGYDGVSVGMNHSSEITMAATENWDLTHNGSRIDFTVIPDGSVLQTLVARIANNTLSATTLQNNAKSSDPGCTTTADIGKFWFDNTTTTTARKACNNVAGTMTWVTF